MSGTQTLSAQDWREAFSNAIGNIQDHPRTAQIFKSRLQNTIDWLLAEFLSATINSSNGFFSQPSALISTATFAYSTVSSLRFSVSNILTTLASGHYCSEMLGGYVALSPNQRNNNEPNQGSRSACLNIIHPLLLTGFIALTTQLLALALPWSIALSINIVLSCFSEGFILWQYKLCNEGFTPNAMVNELSEHPRRVLTAGLIKALPALLVETFLPYHLARPINYAWSQLCVLSIYQMPWPEKPIEESYEQLDAQTLEPAIEKQNTSTRCLKTLTQFPKALWQVNLALLQLTKWVALATKLLIEHIRKKKPELNFPQTLRHHFLLLKYDLGKPIENQSPHIQRINAFLKTLKPLVKSLLFVFRCSTPREALQNLHLDFLRESLHGGILRIAATTREHQNIASWLSAAHELPGFRYIVRRSAVAFLGPTWGKIIKFTADLCKVSEIQTALDKLALSLRGQVTHPFQHADIGEYDMMESDTDDTRKPRTLSSTSTLARTPSPDTDKDLSNPFSAAAVALKKAEAAERPARVAAAQTIQTAFRGHLEKQKESVREALRRRHLAAEALAGPRYNPFDPKYTGPAP